MWRSGFLISQVYGERWETLAAGVETPKKKIWWITKFSLKSLSRLTLSRFWEIFKTPVRWAVSKCCFTALFPIIELHSRFRDENVNSRMFVYVFHFQPSFADFYETETSKPSKAKVKNKVIVKFNYVVKSTSRHPNQYWIDSEPVADSSSEVQWENVPSSMRKAYRTEESGKDSIAKCKWVQSWNRLVETPSGRRCK